MRLLHAEGTPLGLSTAYRILTDVRTTIPTPLLVRFEGVAGEFAQSDFGQVSVRLIDGTRRHRPHARRRGEARRDRIRFRERRDARIRHDDLRVERREDG